MSFNRENPYTSTLLKREELTLEGSSRNTFHLELSLPSSGFSYKCGDSVAIFPKNLSEEVNRVLKQAKLKGKESVTCPKTNQSFSLFEYLKSKAHIGIVKPQFIKRLKEFLDHEKKNSPELDALIENREDLKAFCSTHHLWDTLELFPVKLNAQELIEQLPPLNVRFYSIASSPSSASKTLDLTIAHTRYKDTQERLGVASHYLLYDLKVGDTVDIYPHPSKNFALPEDDSPILMVGPGTGVAPFRGFMIERLSRFPQSKNWLFFGERNQKTDFFYEKLWKEMKEEGILKLSTAFSRDQEHKIYVQDRLLEQKEEVWRWLEQGAYFYVCGEAQKMAKDVEGMLLKIAQECGSLSEKESRTWLKELRLSKRYQRDIY